MEKVTLIILFTFISIIGEGQKAFSLEEAIRFATGNSNESQIDELAVIDAEAQLAEYKATGLPTLNGNIDYQYNFAIASQPTADFITPAVINVLNANEVTPQPIPFPELQTFNIPFGQDHNLFIGLRAETMVFDGSFFVGLKAQKHFRELIELQKTQTTYDIRSNVSLAYINVLINQRNQEIIEKNISNLNKTLTESKEIYKEGFIEKLDVDRLQLSYDNLTADVSNLMRAIDLSKNILKYQMSYPIDKDIVLTDNIETLLLNISSPNTGQEIDYSARPEYALLKQNEKFLGSNIDLWKKSYFPRVTAFGSISRSIQDNDFVFGTNDWISASAVGMSISVPIIDAGDKKAKIQRAKIDMSENTVRLSEFERSMKLQVRNAQLSYQNALANRQSRQRNMELAQEIYDVAQIKYREGVGSSLEVSQAESDFFAAEQAYINSLFDVLSAKTEIEIAYGKI